MDNRLTRAAAAGAASLVLFGGFTATTATASATPAHRTTATKAVRYRCYWHSGWQSRYWHRGWRNGRGWHNGYWVRDWHRGYWVCPRR